MPLIRSVRHLVAMLVPWLLAGCVESSDLPVGAAPGEWTTASPGDVGLDPEPLESMRISAHEGAFQNLHSVLVVRNGTLVFEEYFGEFGAETLQYTASVSKSVGSILLGVAMDDGLMPGLDDGILESSLADVLPEYAEALSDDPRKQIILLRHALSMSGGLEWDEQTYPYSDARNDWIRASQSDDPVGFALSRPVVAPPGSVFNYNGGYSILVSYLVQRAAGMTAEGFAADRLFGPLGIETWEWEALRSGLTDTDGGLHLRPRDMAKLGQLFLNGGTWNGERVVSRGWVDASARLHFDSDGMPDYGLQWWRGAHHYADRSAFTYFASGHGGQRIHVFPELDLVVVITQQVFDNPFADLNALAILARHVLPAADPAGRFPEPVAVSSEELGRYAGRYVDDGEEVRVWFENDLLLAEAEGAPTLELTAVGDTRFAATVAGLLDIFFEFRVDAAGAVEGLRTTFGFDESEFTRVGSDGSDGAEGSP